MTLSIRQWLAEHKIELTHLWTPGVQATGVAFRLVQEMQVKSLTPLDICPMAEVLELPLSIAWPQIEPLTRLTVELLRILSRKKPLRRNEGTWLAFQIAYLSALQKILEQEYNLRRPWLDRANVPVSRDEQGRQSLSDPQLQAMLKTLRPGKLSDTQAEQALSLIGESFLVQQMNNLAIAWFVSNGAEETEAKLLVQRLVHGLPGYLLVAIAENAVPLAQLQKFVRLGNLATGREISLTEPENLDLPGGALSENSLDLPREYYRATLLQALSAPILGELFGLPDLYIPLKGQGVKSEGSETHPNPVDLMDWVMEELKDLESVAVIEALPGQGKTSFCQMLASKVAQELYPTWMPILIRLRDATLGHTLQQTLDSAFPCARFTDADGWLSPLSPPCLLLLDGLNELPRSPQTERHLSAFLDQVRQFLSKDNNQAGRLRHKIVLTCRSNTLVGTDSNTPLQAHRLPALFKRIALQPLDQEQLKHWFKNWSKLQSKSIAQAYFNFLKQSGVFHYRLDVKEFAILVHQPLMLFLLGILYRDGRLDQSIFPLLGSQVRFETYDRLCRWLLGTAPDGISTGDKMTIPVREGMAHASRSPEAIANLLQGRTPQEVRHQMQVAALTVLQSGKQSCTTADISSRLATQNPITTRDLPAFYFYSLSSQREPQIVTQIGSSVLTRQDTSPPPICIEFSHPNLGEYLGAEAIAQRLKAFTQRVQDPYGEVAFTIGSPAEVAQQLYHLLSFGILSVEMEELVVERLRREEMRDRASFSFEVLFERLYRFYRSYCRGRWMDEGMAHNARSHLQTLHNSLNAVQVDAVVGLNVFLLLCACQREAQTAFSPCGDPAVPEEFNPDRLLTLIGKTSVLSPIAFWERARNSLSQLDLSRACLHHVLLVTANFWKTNLFAAELVGANLANANLQEANLSWANLTGANLSGVNLSAAKLEGANLTGANLLGANLQLANLTNACLFDAQLDEGIKHFAEKNGALFSLKQYQAFQKAIASMEIMRTHRIDEPQASDDTILLLERAEGSTIAPDRSDYDNYDSEETVFLE